MYRITQIKIVAQTLSNNKSGFSYWRRKAAPPVTPFQYRKTLTVKVWFVYQIRFISSSLRNFCSAYMPLPPEMSHSGFVWAYKRRWSYISIRNNVGFYVAVINRAGGLYGRILTEVVSTDRTQWDLYTRPRSRFSHTDRLSLVNKMFIICQKKQAQFNSFNLTGLY